MKGGSLPLTDAATLFLLPALPTRPCANGSFVLTRKFIDGATEMSMRWPGPMVVLIDEAELQESNLDELAVHPSDLSFSLEPLPHDDAALVRRVRGGALAVVSLVDKHVRMGEVCKAAGVPLVVYTEYTLRTRLQIARIASVNPLVRWRRQWWEQRLQRQMEPVIHGADGLQCNGTPTDDAYRHLNANRLLYFDTRVREEMLVPMEVLERRTAELHTGRPLRLAFSGRLARMKGADHLPRVARELRRLGVPFVMDICGAGTLEPAIRRDIDKWRLREHVQMRGVLEFRSELVPFISRQVDLFVCCHRQGDPSCTYLETMSCGVPIAGYDNEAFNGLVRISKVGWLSPLDDPAALAARIAELAADRASLSDAAFNARSFAARHTFERTMDARVNHMLGASKLRDAAVEV